MNDMATFRKVSLYFGLKALIIIPLAYSRGIVHRYVTNAVARKCDVRLLS